MKIFLDTSIFMVIVKATESISTTQTTTSNNATSENDQTYEIGIILITFGLIFLFIGFAFILFCHCYCCRADVRLLSASNSATQFSDTETEEIIELTDLA